MRPAFPHLVGSGDPDDLLLVLLHSAYSKAPSWARPRVARVIRRGDVVLVWPYHLRTDYGIELRSGETLTTADDPVLLAGPVNSSGSSGEDPP